MADVLRGKAGAWGFVERRRPLRLRHVADAVNVVALVDVDALASGNVPVSGIDTVDATAGD